VLNNCYAELSQLETIRSIRDDVPVQEMIRCILTDLFAFNDAHPEFARLLAWENLQGAVHLDPESAREARLPGWNRLIEILRRARDAGRIRRDLDLNWFVYVLQAITVVYFTNRHTMQVLTAIPFDRSETIDEFIDRYSQLLAGGISATSGRDASRDD
jgi:hypothetical protein